MIRLRLALILTASVAAAATATACSPRPLAEVHMGAGGVHVQTQEPADTALAVADRLDCPAEIGVLTRTAAAADGASCDYRSEKGVIHLAFADDAAGDPKAALASLKGQLDAELPGVAQKATIQVVSEKDAFGGKHDKVDMPFLHVEDDGKGGSHVRLLGINIDSEDGHHHHGRVVHTDSDDDDATAGNTVASTTPPEKRGVELVYVLVSGKPSPQGFHVVGYVAKGPPTGKLVVATFRYRNDKTFDRGDHHDSDVDQLMALNVKPA